MKDFSRGVSYYTKGRIELGFPEDDVCCRWCPLMGVEIKTDRFYCRRTGEYLLAPNYMIGTQCPIDFTDSEVEDDVP